MIHTEDRKPRDSMITPPEPNYIQIEAIEHPQSKGASKDMVETKKTRKIVL